jgi:hypothetical protein
MQKQRNHNEWMFPVSLGGRKSCPDCKAKVGPGELIWGWYEYVRAKKRLVRHFCKSCFPEVREKLNSHSGDCGCTVTLQICTTDDRKPAWMTLEQPEALCASA